MYLGGRAGSIQAAINLEIDSPDITHINVKVYRITDLDWTRIQIRFLIGQCFGSGFDPDSIRSVDPYSDSESGSGVEEGIKMTHKHIKN